MSISVMKQALEALNIIKSSCSEGRMAHAENEAAIAEYILRQAIAEAEKQEPAFYVIQATDRFGEGYEQTFWEDPAGFPVYTRPVVHEVRCTYPQCQATNGCVGACSKTEPVHASDMSEKHVHESDKDLHEHEDDIYDIWVEQGTCQENRQVAKNATTDETPPCKTDPRAPHGFDRNASHSADRYVCECEGWEPPMEWVGLTPTEFNSIKETATTVGYAMIKTEAMLKEKNIKNTLEPQAPVKESFHKEWVGLMDEEIIKLWGSYFPRAMEFYQAIEAKLKEKNGG